MNFFSILNKYSKSHVRKTTCFLRDKELQSHLNFESLSSEKETIYLSISKLHQSLKILATIFSSAKLAEGTCSLPEWYIHILTVAAGIEDHGNKMVKLDRKIRLNKSSKIKIDYLFRCICLLKQQRHHQSFQQNPTQTHDWPVLFETLNGTEEFL